MSPCNPYIKRGAWALRQHFFSFSSHPVDRSFMIVYFAGWLVGPFADLQVSRTVGLLLLLKRWK